MKFLSKNKKPLTFISIYLLTIIIFSAIYTVMGDDFYHSTVQYERNTDNLNSEIRISVEKSIKDSFKEYYGHDSAYLDENNKWLLNIDDLYVSRFYFEDDKLTFDIRLYITSIDSQVDNEESSGFIQFGDGFKLVHNNSGQFVIGAKNPEQILYFDILGNSEINITGLELELVDYKKIFRLKEFSGNSVVGIKFPYSLSKSINTYNNSLNGFPSELRGNYFRMLYLSMVTITTLGYGDILPLTNRARILVGIEAVLGIVIIGWFANSIFNGARQRDEEN